MVRSEDGGCAGNNPASYSDPFGTCEKPAGLKKGEVGICIETFIKEASAGVPSFAANHRTYSSTGGGYKTSDRFIVGADGVRDVSHGVGKTGSIPGIGQVQHTVEATDGATTVHATAVARTLSPWPPFDINYRLDVTVTGKGDVSVSGVHDGFPSYEVWVYKEGEDPELVYSHDEGNVGELAGCCDVKVP